MKIKHFSLLVLFAFLPLYLYSSLSLSLFSCPLPLSCFLLLSFIPSQVFSPETMEAFLARTIVPKLAYCLQSLPITPHQQEIGTPSPSSLPSPLFLVSSYVASFPGPHCHRLQHDKMERPSRCQDK